MRKMSFTLYMFQIKIFHLNLLHLRMMKAITVYIKHLKRMLRSITKHHGENQNPKKGFSC